MARGERRTVAKHQGEVVLKVKNLQVFHGKIRGVKGTSFHVHQGETIALVGPNGAGKSSTLMAISGLATWQGEITVFGKGAKGLSPPALVRMGVVQVPEGRQVFSSLTVEENLLLGSYGARLGRAERGRRLDEVYAIFPRLAERRGQMAGSLSGGEQQMLALGRGLMGDPRLLLLDEPSLGLAPIIVDEIYQVLERLRKERKLTMVLVEQNASLALGFSHRAYLMESGVVIMQGDREELLQDNTVVEAYLGGGGGFFD